MRISFCLFSFRPYLESCSCVGQIFWPNQAFLTLSWLALVFSSPSSGPKPISLVPSLSLFHYIVFQIHCCVWFELIFTCAHVYRHPLQRLPFSLPNVTVPTRLLQKHSLFLSSGTASHISVFLTPLGSGLTLFVEEGLCEPFAMAFRASLFRYMATGLPILINVKSNFPRMLSYA